MHPSTKDFLTTKLTLRLGSGQAPGTKGSDSYDLKLRVPFDFAQGMLRVFVVKSVSLFGFF